MIVGSGATTEAVPLEQVLDKLVGEWRRRLAFRHTTIASTTREHAIGYDAGARFAFATAVGELTTALHEWEAAVAEAKRRREARDAREARRL